MSDWNGMRDAAARARAGVDEDGGGEMTDEDMELYELYLSKD